MGPSPFHLPSFPFTLGGISAAGRTGYTGFIFIGESCRRGELAICMDKLKDAAESSADSWAGVKFHRFPTGGHMATSILFTGPSSASTAPLAPWPQGRR